MHVSYLYIIFQPYYSAKPKYAQVHGDGIVFPPDSE